MASLKACACLGEPAEGAEGVAEVIVSRRQGRHQSHGFLTVGQRFLGLAAVDQELAQVGLGHGQAGVDLDRCPKGGQCLVKLPILVEQAAQVVMGHGELGPEGQGTQELVSRFLPAVQCLQGQAEVVGGLGEVGLQTHRGPAALDGALVVPQGTVGLGQVCMVGNAVGTQRDGTIDVLDRPAGLPYLVMQHSQQMQRIRILWLPRQDALVDPRRFLQLARLLLLERDRQFVVHEIECLSVLPSGERVGGEGFLLPSPGTSGQGSGVRASCSPLPVLRVLRDRGRG